VNPSRNLFLIGPTGAGKSAIGRRLAEVLELPFADLDSEIESRTGTDIPRIFDVEGEAGFRRRERELLAEFTARDGVVLAAGAGAVLDPANRAVLTGRGFVLWLETGVDQQLERLARDRRRPLLRATDRRERLEAMARERDPIYRDMADLSVASGDDSPAGAAARVAKLLERHWTRLPGATESA
jgi:shikimate kinase